MTRLSLWGRHTSRLFDEPETLRERLEWAALERVIDFRAAQAQRQRADRARKRKVLALALIVWVCA